jgi:hypothetical protein
MAAYSAVSTRDYFATKMLYMSHTTLWQLEFANTTLWQPMSHGSEHTTFWNDAITWAILKT